MDSVSLEPHSKASEEMTSQGPTEYGKVDSFRKFLQTKDVFNQKTCWKCTSHLAIPAPQTQQRESRLAVPSTPST